MLPERYRELLTAYVDGELSARQRRTLQKLLRRSAEARRLLKQMQADSHELRALQPARLEQDLSDSVLTLIAQRQIQPPRPRPAPAALPVVAGSIWPYVAAAAAILLAIGGASYLFFASSFEPVKATGPIAAREEHKLAPQPNEPVQPAQPRKEPVEKNQADKPAERPLPKSEDDPTPPVVARDKPHGTDEAKLPVTPDEAITAPSMEMFNLKKTDVALPVVIKLSQLEQEARRRFLLDELQKASSFRLELPSANGSKVFDRVEAACKTENIAVLIETAARERLKKPQLKTNYVVYLENITAEELVRWLQRFTEEDKKAQLKKKPEPQLEAVVLTQMTKQDREQLSKLLGVDPATIQPKGPLGTDLGKPLSDVTAEQVAAVLAGQGGSPRPVSAPPVAKAPEQTALVLAYNPVRPNPKAAEIKRWFDIRKAPRQGTLQILLVLRSTTA